MHEWRLGSRKGAAAARPRRRGRRSLALLPPFGSGVLKVTIYKYAYDTVCMAEHGTVRLTAAESGRGWKTV